MEFIGFNATCKPYSVLVDVRRRISDHFYLSELIRTSVGDTRKILNHPDFLSIVNLTRLCELVLEPLRGYLCTEFHIPYLIVNSAYRSATINALVGGSSTSQHMSGLAADIPLLSPDLAFKVRSDDKDFKKILRYYLDAIYDLNLPFDQLIFERKGTCVWLHISIAPVGKVPRRQALNIPEWYKPLPF